MSVKAEKETTVIPDKTFPLNVFFTRKIRLHWHDHLEWIYVREGRVRVQIDDMTEVLEKGELAFVHPKQIHGAVPLEGPGGMAAIVFNEALLRNSGLDNTESRYFSPVLTQRIMLPRFLKKGDPLHAEIVSAVTRILEEFEQKREGFELLIKSDLFRLFGLIVRHHPEWSRNKQSAEAEHRAFSRLFAFLRESYSRPVRLEHAARMVNLSPNHFCHVFKHMTGKTLVEYVNTLRVHEAERLLKETSWTIEEIAARVGFGSATYFGRVIKKYKNATPTELRLKSGQVRDRDDSGPADGPDGPERSDEPVGSTPSAGTGSETISPHS